MGLSEAEENHDSSNLVDRIFCVCLRRTWRGTCKMLRISPDLRAIYQTRTVDEAEEGFAVVAAPNNGGAARKGDSVFTCWAGVGEAGSPGRLGETCV